MRTRFTERMSAEVKRESNLTKAESDVSRMSEFDPALLAKLLIYGERFRQKGWVQFDRSKKKFKRR